MEYLAAQLAQYLLPGDCYLLFGDVGAGKSVWSRAFVRAAAEDPELPVPSPTYLLQNIYDDHGYPEIHHFDLYRLNSEQDLVRLDLSESFTKAVSLVEWAERLQHNAPDDHLAVHIKIIEEQPRLAAGQVQHQDSPSCYPSSKQGSQSTTVDDGRDEEGAYSDKRCRQVTVVPHGAMWRMRAQVLANTLSSLPRTEDGGFLTF